MFGLSHDLNATPAPDRRFEVRRAYALPTPAGLRNKGTPSAGRHQ